LPQTGFVMPTTRFLAATASLRNPRLSGAEPLAAELWPSGAGDPLVEPGGKPAPPIGRVEPPAYLGALSAAAAGNLPAATRERLDGRVGRSYNGSRETLALRFTVVQITEAGLDDRDVALVPLTLLEAIEDFREGVASEELASTGAPAKEIRSSYASFRLYARD